MGQNGPTSPCTAADLAAVQEIFPEGAFGRRYPAGQMPGWAQ